MAMSSEEKSQVRRSRVYGVAEGIGGWGNSERSGAICEQGVFLINAFAYLY